MANPNTGTEQRRSLERARRAFRCLRAFHQTIDGAGSRAELLRQNCRNAVSEGGYPCAWAAYGHEGDDGTRLHPVALAGHCDGCTEGLERAEPVMRAWTSAQPVAAGIGAGDEQWQQEAAQLGLRSCIAVPLLRGDTACGVFVLFDVEEEAFDHEEAEVLQEWIQDTARAIETLDLKRERERLLSIIDATPDFIAIIGAGNLITYCNPAAVATLGLESRDELIGRPLQCCHPQWAVELIEQEAIPTALRNGYWQGEVALLAADGSEVPASQILLAHRPENGDSAYLSTIIRDLRPHRRSEAQLRSSEAAYRRIIHIAREGFRSVGGKLSPPTAPVRSKIPVHQGNTVLLLDIDSICAVRAEGHYTRIYTHEGELFSGESFARVSERLASHEQFFQTHRSYIVNLDCVEAIERADSQQRLLLCNIHVPVSRRSLDSVRHALGID